MAFPDFTLDSIRADLGLTLSPTGLFPSASPVSEAVISPVLMATAELGSSRLIVHSGEWLDVDASRELNGEADSIIARSRISSPRSSASASRGWKRSAYSTRRPERT